MKIWRTKGGDGGMVCGVVLYQQPHAKHVHTPRDDMMEKVFLEVLRSQSVSHASCCDQTWICALRAVLSFVVIPTHLSATAIVKRSGQDL